MRTFSFIAVLIWAVCATAGFVLVRSWCVEAQDALAAHLKDDVQKRAWQNASEEACVKGFKESEELADRCLLALQACAETK